MRDSCTSGSVLLYGSYYPERMRGTLARRVFIKIICLRLQAGDYLIASCWRETCTIICEISLLSLSLLLALACLSLIMARITFI